MAEFSLIQLGELICGLVVSVLHGLENRVKERAASAHPPSVLQNALKKTEPAFINRWPSRSLAVQASSKAP